MKTLAILAALALLGMTGGAAFVWSGIYDISATDQHLPPTYWLIEKTMRRSVARRGNDVSVPPLGAPEQVAHGLALYRIHCVQCHGAPGVPPEPFALGLTPLPAPLVQTGREWAPGEIFWVVKYGIKMTGMPAWEFRMSDDDIWSVVALVQRLPSYSPQAYQRTPTPTLKPHEARTPAAPDISVDRGRIALQQYACAGCHRIPGVTGHEARVGPPLAGIASRTTLGGVLPNSPDNLVRWIREPQQHSPLTAMPDLRVTERDARDIAAYLATLK
ncbi:MAG TPA: c-type cytochrome [Burkholderiales bacterium]|nr:c-type cytochrome [Burkholderiales bacterium]